MSKETIATEVETLFGQRCVVFVKYPARWTIRKVVAQLTWAKAYQVDDLQYDGIVVRAYVKPHYLERFRRDNDKYVLAHYYEENPLDPAAKVFVVNDTIYDE